MIPMKNVSPLQKKRQMARSRLSVDKESNIIKTGEAINGDVTWYWAEINFDHIPAYKWCWATFGDEGANYNKATRWLSTSHVFYFSDSADRLAFILRWS